MKLYCLIVTFISIFLFSCAKKNDSPYTVPPGKDTVKTDNIQIAKNPYPYTDTFKGALLVSFLDYIYTKHDTDTTFVLYATHPDSTKIIFTCSKYIDLLAGYQCSYTDSLVYNPSGKYKGSLRFYDYKYRKWQVLKDILSITNSGKSLSVSWDIPGLELIGVCAESGEDIGQFTSK